MKSATKIQLTEQEAARVFDQLYLEVDRWFKKNQPCQIERKADSVLCIGCEAHSFWKSSAAKELHIGHWGVTQNLFCCSRCKYHQTKVGCTADRPLFCRSFLCMNTRWIVEQSEQGRKEVAKLMHLREIITAFHFDKYYVSREETLKSFDEYCLRTIDLTGRPTKLVRAVRRLIRMARKPK